MNEQDLRVNHATFRLERTYPHPIERVFFAHSDMACVKRWRVEGGGFEIFSHAFDFRVGGEESATFRYGDGPEIGFYAQYQDIIPDRRIVSSYRMTMAGVPFSASLVTIELAPVTGGTRLMLTEQGAYYGDPEATGGPAGREEGTRELLEALARELDRSV